MLFEFKGLQNLPMVQSVKGHGMLNASHLHMYVITMQQMLVCNKSMTSYWKISHFWIRQGLLQSLGLQKPLVTQSMKATECPAYELAHTCWCYCSEHHP